MTVAAGPVERAPLFDVHCHLQAADFDADREAVIARARRAGVTAVLVVAEDLADAERVLELAARHPDFVRPAVGVHPDKVAAISDAEVAAVEALARAEAPRLAAIGEVGLDFRPCWEERVRVRQLDVLERFVALSLELDLPLSVHSRSAGRHAVDALARLGARGACLHAFDGRAVHAERGVAAGFFFSLPPSLVRSPVKRKLARRLPAESLLLETDSPVLGPEPGARNEPANLSLVLAELARLRGETEAVLAAAIAANTRRALPRLVAASSAA